MRRVLARAADGPLSATASSPITIRAPAQSMKIGIKGMTVLSAPRRYRSVYLAFAARFGMKDFKSANLPISDVLVLVGRFLATPGVVSGS